MGDLAVTDSVLRRVAGQTGWDGLKVVVTGFGVSGFAAADTLTHLGASVVVLDDSPGSDRQREQAELLEFLGATVRLGAGSSAELPADTDLVVTSPGWRPTSPILKEAIGSGIPVWGEVELAWQLRGPDAAPWLAVTGTNGKTTTVSMLESILLASGARAVAVGNVGKPIIEAVMDPEGFDVLAVELSSYQLHWLNKISAESSVVLNIAPDHIDWHGSLDSYAAAKAKIYTDVQRACVYNVEDPRTRQLVEQADVIEGARAIGFTLGIPAPGMVGVVEDVLADRAFVPNRTEAAAELGSLGDLPDDSPHNVANALAAAALARAHGVEPVAVRDGLRNFSLGPHRISRVATIDGAHYVNDSKATNTHAAQASLLSAESVVWIAGGLAKGAEFDDLVTRTANRLRAAVLIGRDRGVIAQALARHAPEIPVVEVDSGQTELMDRVVETAASLAQPGDTVLLAPGCASMDQFVDYAHRGNAFVEAVHRWADTR